MMILESITGNPTAAPTLSKALFRSGFSTHGYGLNSQLAGKNLYDMSESSTYRAAIACMCIGSLIILHSFYLHRRKFNSARILADVAAAALIACGALAIEGKYHY